MRAKSGGMSLVSSCLHKAAPHQIAFVLNIWIGGYGPRTRWLEGMPREKEKGSGYNTPYPTQGLHPAWRERMTKRGKAKEWLEWRARARRKESSTVYDTTRFLGILQFREPILQPLPLRPPNLPNESALRPTSSILPAARYRLPNNLTDCSVPATSGIRVLVSFQNLSKYPAILTWKEEGRRRRFVENYLYLNMPTRSTKK